MAEELKNQIDPRYVEYSRRFGYLGSMAKPYDFFSKDGKTWDPDANWIKFPEYIATSEEFETRIYDEISYIMKSVPLAKEDEFSEEFIKFLARVEERQEQ
jgi:hypothetical protein